MTLQCMFLTPKRRILASKWVQSFRVRAAFWFVQPPHSTLIKYRTSIALNPITSSSSGYLSTFWEHTISPIHSTLPPIVSFLDSKPAASIDHSLLASSSQRIHSSLHPPNSLPDCSFQPASTKANTSPASPNSAPQLRRWAATDRISSATALLVLRSPLPVTVPSHDGTPSTRIATRACVSC